MTEGPHDDAAVSRESVEAQLEALLRLDTEDACELMLVRHAEPDQAGHPDQPRLSQRGLWQAGCLADRCSHLYIETVYCAPERPALDTGRLLAEYIGRPLVPRLDLADIEFSPAAADNGDYGQRFCQLPRWDALPGYTPSRAFRRRVIEAIESIVSCHTGRRAVIVTHASVINAYLSMVLSIARDLFFQPEFTSISIVRSSGGLYALRSLNDSSHLQNVVAGL